MHALVPVRGALLRRLIKAPTTVLANLVLGENRFAEFHQGKKNSPENLANALLPLCGAPRSAGGIGAYRRLHAYRGGPVSSQAAADIVIDYALKRKPRPAELTRCFSRIFRAISAAFADLRKSRRGGPM